MDDTASDGETQTSSNILGIQIHEQNLNNFFAFKFGKLNFHLTNFWYLYEIDLEKKLAAIELENRTIREEFNGQRAKLKDLFLQKEGIGFTIFLNCDLLLAHTSKCMHFR